MSSTSSRWHLAVTAGVLFALLLYGVLLVGDRLLRNRLRPETWGPEVAQIWEQRSRQEDPPLIAAARAAGYRNVVFPELFEKGAWRELADRHGVAPLAAQPDTLLYQCNEGYGLVQYRSDRYGFRNPDALWDLPAIDLMLVGDSYVQGSCVDDRSTMAGQLNAGGRSALSLGTVSNSPIDYAAVIKVFTPVIKPRTLVVVYYANDNLTGEERSVFRSLYIDGQAQYFATTGGAAAAARPALSPQLLQLYAEVGPLLDAELQRPGSTTGEGAGSAATVTGGSGAGRVVASLARSASLPSIRAVLGGLWSRLQPVRLPYGSTLAIDTAIGACRANGCRPLIVYLPNSQTWQPDRRSPGYARALGEYAGKAGVRFLDLGTVLAPLGAEAYAIKGFHLSPRGYAAAAAAIAAASREP